MELLGPNVKQLFYLKNKKIPFHVVGMIGDQVLDLLEYLHSKSFIHRDIKPDNILIGLNNNRDIFYLIDYGLAKKYKDSHSNVHIPCIDNKGFIGTARYASINTHLGMEQSRRDDLESFMYMMIYLLSGSLPWQGIKKDTAWSSFNGSTTKHTSNSPNPRGPKTKRERILELKMNIHQEQLTKGLPCLIKWHKCV